MPKYVLAYHGGNRPASREEGASHMAKWKAWMDGLGEAVVDRGTPLGMSRTVSADGVADGGGANPLSGLTVVRADTIEAASEMARACPHLDLGGTIEVAEMMDIEM